MTLDGFSTSKCPEHMSKNRHKPNYRKGNDLRYVILVSKNRPYKVRKTFLWGWLADNTPPNPRPFKSV